MLKNRILMTARQENKYKKHKNIPNWKLMILKQFLRFYEQQTVNFRPITNCLLADEIP